MSAISTILARLRAAIWAIDVRDDIANAIEQCYSDVSNPTLKTEALEAALQNKIDEGEMAALTIGDHTITAAKLAQGVIDNTLATSGAAADAVETGRQIGLLKADLGDQTGIISKTPGYYINLTTDPVDISNPSPNSTGLTYALVDCSEGDKFVINAVGATYGRAWGFLDSSNHVLSMADANATVTDLELTAPTNAVKLIINDKGGRASYKVGDNLASKVGTIEDDIKTADDKIFANTLSILSNGLTGDIRDAILQCFNNVAWVNTQGQLFYNYLKNALSATGYIKMHWNTETDSEICKKVIQKIADSGTVNGQQTAVIKTRATRGTVLLNVGVSTVLNENLTDSGYYLIPIPENATTIKISSPNGNYLFWAHQRKYSGLAHIFSYISFQSTSTINNPYIIDVANDTAHGRANMLCIFCKRSDEGQIDTLPEIDILFME